MKIEVKPISALNPAPYNPRIDLQPGDEEYEAIRYSLDHYGLVQPIVWNQRTGNVISGHQRLTVLQNQGVKEVEVSVVDLDDIAEKQLNVALNKIEGSWDNDKLSDLLAELGDDAYYTGFTQEEIESLQNEVESYFDEDFVNDDDNQPEQAEEDSFPITLTFDKVYEKSIKDYVKKHGEIAIVDVIIQKIEAEV